MEIVVMLSVVVSCSCMSMTWTFIFIICGSWQALAGRFLLLLNMRAGNTKGGSITVLLTSCLTCLDLPVLKIKTKKCQYSYNWFQTSQTGGQLYSDTSPLVFPGLSLFTVLIYVYDLNLDFHYLWKLTGIGRKILTPLEHVKRPLV